MTTPEEQRQANVDHAARTLYDRDHLCVHCFLPVTLAGLLTPDEARAMLCELKGRRRELGLLE